jgi:hypothetical protein
LPQTPQTAVVNTCAPPLQVPPDLPFLFWTGQYVISYGMIMHWMLLQPLVQVEHLQTSHKARCTGTFTCKAVACSECDLQSRQQTCHACHLLYGVKPVPFLHCMLFRQLRSTVLSALHLQCLEVPASGTTYPYPTTCRTSGDSLYTNQVFHIFVYSGVQPSPPASPPPPIAAPAPPNLSSNFVGKVVRLSSSQYGDTISLDAHAGANNNVVIAYPNNGLVQQTWLIADAGGGNVYIKEQYSGTGRWAMLLRKRWL